MLQTERRKGGPLPSLLPGLASVAPPPQLGGSDVPTRPPLSQGRVPCSRLQPVVPLGLREGRKDKLGWGQSGLCLDSFPPLLMAGQKFPGRRVQGGTGAWLLPP